MGKKADNRTEKAASLAPITLFDSAAIAARRIPIEDTDFPVQESSVFKCQWCNAGYKYERAFMNHKCQARIKEERLRTPIGQMAYFNYNLWMKYRKFGEQSPEAFKNSRYFNTICMFAEHAKLLKIDLEIYIRVMVKNELDPTMWRTVEAHQLYKKFQTTVDGAVDGAVACFKFLSTESEKAEQSPADFVTNMDASAFLHYVRCGLLSPWVIFRSQVFKNKVATFSQDETKAFDKIIDVEMWQDLFKKTDKEIVEEISLSIKELGL